MQMQIYSSGADRNIQKDSWARPQLPNCKLFD